MRALLSTVTKKIIIGYLVIVVFSLLAVGFALFRLHQQTNQAEHLVNVDFRAFELVRDLQQNLLAQENIEKQLLILRDPALRELRLNRNEELTRYFLLLNCLYQIRYCKYYSNYYNKWNSGYFINLLLP